MGDLADQGFIAHLLAKAADHRSNLGIKQRAGNHTVIDMKNLQILPGRVKYLDHIGVAEQRHQRVQRQAGGQRIDQCGIGRLVAGKGHLNQTQLGIIGAFAQKFRIDGDIGMGSSTVAKRGQALGRGNDLHRAPSAVLNKTCGTGPLRTGPYNGDTRNCAAIKGASH